MMQQNKTNSDKALRLALLGSQRQPRASLQSRPDPICCLQIWLFGPSVITGRAVLFRVCRSTQKRKNTAT